MCIAYPDAEQAENKARSEAYRNWSKTPPLTGVDYERRTLQIEGERNPVGTNGNELSQTCVATDLVPVIRQFICRDQELPEVDTSVSAPVIDSGIY